MDGQADGVIIQYFGDLAETLPLARDHCAQYERVPREQSHSVVRRIWHRSAISARPRDEPATNRRP